MFGSDSSGLDVSRYDLLLALIPAAFLVGLIAAQLGAFPTRHSLAASSLVGAIAVADALFLNPPRPPAHGRG